MLLLELVKVYFCSTLKIMISLCQLANSLTTTPGASVDSSLPASQS